MTLQRLRARAMLTSKSAMEFNVCFISGGVKESFRRVLLSGLGSRWCKMASIVRVVMQFASTFPNTVFLILFGRR